MRRPRPHSATITVTPDAEPGTPIQIANVIGVWSKKGGSSHVEFGDGQIIAVVDSPIRIERRLEKSGLRGPKYDDATRLPELKRATLLSRVKAVCEWFRYPASSFEAAAANIDQTVRDTLKGNVKWEQMSDTVYEGAWSTRGDNASGVTFNYRLEIESDEHISYQHSSVTYGCAMSSTTTVNAGQSSLGDAIKDRAIQEKLAVLMDVAELDAAERTISNQLDQISGLG